MPNSCLSSSPCTSKRELHVHRKADIHLDRHVETNKLKEGDKKCGPSHSSSSRGCNQSVENTCVTFVK